MLGESAAKVEGDVDDDDLFFEVMTECLGAVPRVERCPVQVPRVAAEVPGVRETW